MTDADERIAKLQKLLDRVLTRPEVEAGASDPSLQAAVEASMAEEREKEKENEEREDARKKAEAAAEAREEPPISADDAAPIALESRSRLVAAEELTDDDVVADEPPAAPAEDSIPLVRRSRPTSDAAVAERPSDGRVHISHEVKIAQESMMDDDQLADAIAAEELHSVDLLDEEAPTSSRRPIAAENIADIPEAPYSSPRHTPPPESGKQVAATPMSETELAQALSPLTPQVVRPELPSRRIVAEFKGAAPVTSAPTFGEVLDDSLKL